MGAEVIIGFLVGHPVAGGEDDDQIVDLRLFEPLFCLQDACFGRFLIREIQHMHFARRSLSLFDGLVRGDQIIRVFRRVAEVVGLVFVFTHADPDDVDLGPRHRGRGCGKDRLFQGFHALLVEHRNLNLVSAADQGNLQVLFETLKLLVWERQAGRAINGNVVDEHVHAVQLVLTVRRLHTEGQRRSTDRHRHVGRHQLQFRQVEIMC